MARLNIWTGTAAALAIFPCLAHASTLEVTGGPGLDAGALCPTTNFFCPGPPDLAPEGTGAVTGSFTYNPTAGTISFALTLSAPVTFSNGTVSETIDAGSLFSAQNVSVSAPSGGVVQGTGTGSATILYGTSMTQVVDSGVSISALSCTVGTGQCGVTFGATGVGPINGQGYTSSLTFNTSVSPVPAPAAAWLLLSGIGGLFGFSARRFRPARPA